jgi:hypothetical protein
MMLTALSLWARKSELKEYTLNGEDRRSDVPPEWRRLVYEKGYLPGTATTGANGETVLPSYQVPFSNLSFKLGIEYSF